MNDDIKSLKEPLKKSPPIWSMFEDAAGGYSFTRIVAFIVVTLFFSVWSYLSISTNTMIVPPKEMVYVLITFAAAKPIQRFAEVKEIENQLNYNFQMTQIENKKLTDE